MGNYCCCQQKDNRIEIYNGSVEERQIEEQQDNKLKESEVNVYRIIELIESNITNQNDFLTNENEVYNTPVGIPVEYYSYDDIKSNNNNKPDICSICLDNLYNTNDDIYKYCENNHFFHENCMILIKDNCPLCRVKLFPIPILYRKKKHIKTNDKNIKKEFLKIVNDDYIYEGFVNVDGYPHNKGKLIVYNSFIYLGNFENGVKNGNGKYIKSTGLVYEGFFKDNVPNGEGKLYYDEYYYEGLFENGVALDGDSEIKFLLKPIL